MFNLGLDVELLDEGQMFYRNLLAGHFHKDLIRVILEESGYEVYPYGYESFLTPLKIKFERGEIEPTEISKKIRSTPDLLVFDPEKGTVELLEVKSTRWDWTNDVLIDALPRYQQYWQESMLVIVLPAGHFFYAQYVDRIEPRKDNTFDLREEFEWFEEVFTKVRLDTLYSYKKQIIDFWNRKRESYDPLNPSSRFGLLSLIRELVQCNVDELFSEQNERNLTSRKVFKKAVKKLIDDGKIIEEEGEIRLVS